jgi:chromate transport protein ChrA
MNESKKSYHLKNYVLRDIVLYFLVLGTIGFGDPVALVGYIVAVAGFLDLALIQ